jgi:hypothetical protein
MTDGEEQINVHVYVQRYTKSIGRQSRRSEGRSPQNRVPKTGCGEAKVQEEVGLPVNLTALTGEPRERMSKGVQGEEQDECRWQQ